MSLDEKFIPVRTTIYETVGNLFEKIAGFFGYPKNPGMPTIYEKPGETYFIESLPKHKTYWPPVQRPETWFEMIFGPTPKIDPIPKYIYENKEEGFYNFYVENYSNIFFLPDGLSEFIQVRFNICLDVSLLETIREVLFIGFMVYSQIIILRVAISWFIYLNPYSLPWSFLVAAVDWTEDALQGVLPSILGVNLVATFFLGAIGVIADSLNHIVFTMPFLPSEGEKTKLLINQEMRDVLVFHYLPITWYRYPIPNNIREFWYYERPDILEYMQNAYKDLNIQFLPNSILQKLSQTSSISDYVSTEVLTKENLFDSDVILKSVKFLSENFHNLSFIQNNHFV